MLWWGLLNEDIVPRWATVPFHACCPWRLFASGNGKQFETNPFYFILESLTPNRWLLFPLSAFQKGFCYNRRVTFPSQRSRSLGTLSIKSGRHLWRAREHEREGMIVWRLCFVWPSPGEDYWLVTSSCVLSTQHELPWITEGPTRRFWWHAENNGDGDAGNIKGDDYATRLVTLLVILTVIKYTDNKSNNNGNK